MKKTFFLGLMAIGFLSGNAAYADSGEKIRECSRITSALARLDCYDNLARSLSGQKKAPAPVPMSRSVIPAKPAAAKNPEQTFGSEAVKNKPNAPDAPEKINHIQADVVKVKFGPHKEFLVTLSNGQVWLQKDTQRARLPKDTPFNVTIKRGAMGSYKLIVSDRNTSYRVKRLK